MICSNLLYKWFDFFVHPQDEVFESHTRFLLIWTSAKNSRAGIENGTILWRSDCTVLPRAMSIKLNSGNAKSEAMYDPAMCSILFKSLKCILLNMLNVFILMETFEKLSIFLERWCLGVENYRMN